MKYLKSFENLNESNNIPNSLLTELESPNMKANYTKIKDAIEKAIEILTVNKELGGHIFLMEIAMVESMLGTDPSTVRKSGNGGRGVWQIDKIAFESTKDTDSHPILKKYHKQLKSQDIDWVNIEWNDCNKLIYGAITARLCLLIKPFKISEHRAKRAAQWKNFYNTISGKGTAKKYWEKVALCFEKLELKNNYSGKSLSDFT